MSAPSIIAKGLDALTSDSLRVRTYGTGRACAVCGAHLSRYNPDPVCWAHRDEEPEGITSDVTIDLAVFGECICTCCGKGYPASTEYFRRDNHLRDGLKPMCKTCMSKRDRARYQTPEYRQMRCEKERAKRAKQKAEREGVATG